MSLCSYLHPNGPKSPHHRKVTANPLLEVPNTTPTSSDYATVDWFPLSKVSKSGKDAFSDTPLYMTGDSLCAEHQAELERMALSDKLSSACGFPNCTPQENGSFA
jgi:hypothetical protein